MNIFQKLFSIKPSLIRQDVILTPFLTLDLFRQSPDSEKTKGLLFEVLNEDKFSVIKTGVGINFVSDAVFYLRNTPCKRVYLIGSCGSVSSLDIGEIVVVEKAYAFESLTQTLNNDFSMEAIPADKKLFDNFMQLNKNNCRKADIATISSFYLEETNIFPFKQKDISGVDLESSGFYSASRYVGLSALAILYVTDIVNKKPFYRNLLPREKSLIRDCRSRAISLLCRYIRERSA